MKFEDFAPKKQVQLDEVRLGASDLDKFVNGPEAASIVAGFEAELCYAGLGGGGESDDYDQEEDMDNDTSADSIDEICDFFYDGDYNGRREIQRLREKLSEEFNDWRFEKLSNDWGEVSSEAVKDYIEENDFDFDEEIENYLRDELGLTDEQVDAAVEAAVEYRRFRSVKDQKNARENSEAHAHYAEAADHANEVLDEKVQEAIDNGDYNYDSAREEWEQEHIDDYEESDWLSEYRIYNMSDVPGNYDVTWPYWTQQGSDATNEYNSDGADTLESSLKETLGVRVHASSGYHSATRKPGLWIIEPDSSLEAEDGYMPAEIISPPMPLGECLTKMQEFFQWAKSMKAVSNESTGLHVGISLPHVGGKVDYLKLALFLGDQHVLQQFDRDGNHYARSAFGKIKDDASVNPERVESAIELMRKGLIELAGKTLKQVSGHGKYTSINMKGDYIEFRSMGNDYLDHTDDVIQNVKRYAYATYIASRPDLYRDEYAKKLYKMISKSEGGNMIEVFSKYASGKLSKEQLKAMLIASRPEREAKKAAAAAQSGASTTWYIKSIANGLKVGEVQARSEAEARTLANQWLQRGKGINVNNYTVSQD